MAIAFDVSTVAAAYALTGTQTTSHAGSASARGAVVLIDQNGSAADQVSGVTYGGAAMTRLRFDTEATEAGAGYVYWLDAVAGGTQNVAMTTTGTAAKQLVVATMTVTAGQGVAVAGHNTGTSASVANPAWTITGLTAATVLDAFEVIHSGLTSMTTTPAASWTLISSTDLGAQGRGFARQHVASSGTTLACGWTAATADDFVGSSVAFKEVAGGPTTYQASGTSTVVAASSGNPDRVPLTLAASGTTAAVSATTGNATRVGLVLAAAATVVVIAATSGNVTLAPLILAASGTTTVTTALTGDASRVPLTLAASGTVPAVAATTGNPTRVALTPAASGTSVVLATTSGDVTRVPLTLQCSGTTATVSAASGAPTLQGGQQTLAATGQVAVTSTVTGDATRTPLVVAASGTVDAVTVVSGDAGAPGGPAPVVTHPGMTLISPTHGLTLTTHDTHLELT